MVRRLTLAGIVLYATILGGQPTNVNSEHQAPIDGDLSTPNRVEVLARGLHVPWSIVVLPHQRYR